MVRASILRSVPFRVLFCAKVASAQSQPPSDPRAVAFAAQSIAAVTGGITVADTTLTGSVVWSGSDSGNFTLQALLAFHADYPNVARIQRIGAAAEQPNSVNFRSLLPPRKSV